eukprot:3322371-Rhodomonas_salina.4
MHQEYDLLYLNLQCITPRTEVGVRGTRVVRRVHFQTSFAPTSYCAEALFPDKTTSRLCFPRFDSAGLEGRLLRFGKVTTGVVCLNSSDLERARPKRSSQGSVHELAFRERDLKAAYCMSVPDMSLSVRIISTGTACTSTGHLVAGA